MPAKVIDTEFGHSAPPEGPHTITIHIPGWDNVMRFREGDKEFMTRIKSIYPRFKPSNESMQVSSRQHGYRSWWTLHSLLLTGPNNLGHEMYLSFANLLLLSSLWGSMGSSLSPQPT